MADDEPPSSSAKPPPGFQAGGVQIDPCAAASSGHGPVVILSSKRRAAAIAVADGADGTANAPPTAHGPRIPQDNRGYALLAKAGWQEGTALGKTASALVEPLGVQPNFGTRGLGSGVRAAAGAATTAAATAPKPPPPPPAKTNPTAGADLRRASEHAANQERRDAAQRADAQGAQQLAAEAEARLRRAYSSLRRAFDEPEPLPGGGNPLLRREGGGRGGVTGANPLLLGGGGGTGGAGGGGGSGGGGGGNGDEDLFF